MKNVTSKRIGLTILVFIIVGIVIAVALRLRPKIDDDAILTRPASPVDGFSWDYFLYVPKRVTSPYLLVIPNNTGTVSDDLQVHIKAARNLIEWKKADADTLGAALLVPIFPRPESIGHVYTHALDRDCLQIQQPEYKRLDLQLIAMIDDVRDELSQKGTSLSDQVLLFGFSASGMFANRFTLLHPDRVRAAAIGSPGGWPVAPVAQVEDNDLPYPIGIADITQLTGEAVDIQAFARIPQMFFLGDADDNDASETCYYEDLRELTADIFGVTPLERWTMAEALYAQRGTNATFILYPDVGHEYTDAMRQDVLTFLTAYAQ